MDRDDVLGRSIASRLDEGLRALDSGTAERLRSIREAALARHRPERAFAWAMVGVSGAQVPGLRFLSPRQWVSIGFLLLSLTVFGIWHTQNQRIEELADVDAGLLAGDLPIDAYLDKGLDAWLTRSQQ